MPKVFIKKEKRPNISDLRERDFSPKRDWRILLCVFLVWIAVCFFSTGLLFLAVMRGDISGTKDDLAREEINISETKLKTALKFIESRSASNN